MNDIMNKMEEWLLKEARVENPDTELQDLYTSKMMFGGRWVMDLIEKYAQQQVNDAKTEKEKCTLHSVSKQRELLIAFMEWIKADTLDITWEETNYIIDNYFSNS